MIYIAFYQCILHSILADIQTPISNRSVRNSSIKNNLNHNILSKITFDDVLNPFASYNNVNKSNGRMQNFISEQRVSKNILETFF